MVRRVADQSNWGREKRHGQERNSRRLQRRVRSLRARTNVKEKPSSNHPWAEQCNREMHP
jgi:hypothetical protein